MNYKLFVFDLDETVWTVSEGLVSLIQPPFRKVGPDRLETDAIGARDAGLRGIWLNRTESNAKHPGVTSITSLTELPGIL